MATSAMSGMSGADQDPSQSADGGADQDFTICIYVKGGEISVGVTPGADDDDSDDMSGSGADDSQSPGGDDSSGGGGDDDSGASGAQPVKNIKEALTIALDIYRNGGQMEDADSDFSSGYSSQSASQGGAAPIKDSM